MDRLMRWSGCPKGPCLVYHEPHVGIINIKGRKDSPGMIHNNKVWLTWSHDHNESLRQLK